MSRVPLESRRVSHRPLSRKTSRKNTIGGRSSRRQLSPFSRRHTLRQCCKCRGTLGATPTQEHSKPEYEGDKKFSDCRSVNENPSHVNNLPSSAAIEFCCFRRRDTGLTS